MKRTLAIATALVFALAGCSAAQDTSTGTAEEPAVAEADSTEAIVDVGTSIEWIAAKDGDEAAKGAGFERFGSIDKFTVGDLEFANPTFAYAGGVAQATYETPATMIYVRKAVDNYTTPLSDRNLDEFAAHWHKVYEGTDVACYGPAQGAITVATWTEGDTTYALTFQGLGGDEMSMDTDDLKAIVKGFNEANADKTATLEAQKKEEARKKAEAEKKAEEERKKAAEAANQAKKDTLISEREAETLVERASGGDCVSIDRVSTNQYGECWYAVAVDASGARYEYYVNNVDVYLVHKMEAPKQDNQRQSEEQKQDKGVQAAEHYEGEPVTIFDSIYAEWHQMNDGAWYATFITYNDTQIFAQPTPAGSGWTFTAFADGTTYQVVYSEESSDVGETGPAGVSSHWKELNGDRWF